MRFSAPFKLFVIIHETCSSPSQLRLTFVFSFGRLPCLSQQAVLMHGIRIFAVSLCCSRRSNVLGVHFKTKTTFHLYLFRSCVCPVCIPFARPKHQNHALQIEMGEFVLVIDSSASSIALCSRCSSVCAKRCPQLLFTSTKFSTVSITPSTPRLSDRAYETFSVQQTDHTHARAHTHTLFFGRNERTRLVPCTVLSVMCRAQ